MTTDRLRIEVQRITTNGPPYENFRLIIPLGDHWNMGNYSTGIELLKLRTPLAELCDLRADLDRDIGRVVEEMAQAQRENR